MVTESVMPVVCREGSKNNNVGDDCIYGHVGDINGNFHIDVFAGGDGHEDD